jgi:hypothetical protein
MEKIIWTPHTRIQTLTTALKRCESWSKYNYDASTNFHIQDVVEKDTW